MIKALFLDRDGIINVDHGYVHKIEDFEFVDGIFELCRLAIDKGFLIFVITNQAGIARGYYSVNEFQELTRWMVEAFNERKVTITDVYFCPHHPDKGKAPYKMACKCRKPAAGMLFKAQKEYNIDFTNSIFIGDKISDMQAAENAGIENRILINSQYKDNKEITAKRVADLISAQTLIG